MVIDHPVVKGDMENLFARDIDWKRLEHKTVMITGAYGMLASYLIFYLIYLNEEKQAGIRIIAQGRNQAKMRKCFKDAVEKDYFCECYCDITKELPQMGEIHYIIHAASPANPRYYTECPVEVAEPNALGTYYLLQYAAKYPVEGFLLFSTGDVYGKMNEDIENITEDDMGKVNPLEIHSCYSESKRMAETWCKLFWHEKGVPAKIARIGHTYSPTMDVNQDPRVFAAFIKCVLNRQDVVMLSDGSAKRPFCYVADAIAAFWLILFEGNNGEAYNVCNTQDFLSIRELAQILVSLRPEYHLKVVSKVRSKDDNYLENTSNKQNKPVENKLKEIGWNCEYDVKKGFEKVLTYLS